MPIVWHAENLSSFFSIIIDVLCLDHPVMSPDMSSLYTTTYMYLAKPVAESETEANTFTLMYMCTTYVPEAQFAWKDAEGGKVYTNIFTTWPELTFLSLIWDI